MQKHEDVVQNLNGNVVVNATIQVMVAFTSTPATIYSDPAAQVPIDLLRTDSLGEFSFYAPNGRYDIFAIINGNRVAHVLDALLFDPEDDERITTAITSGSGGSGGGGSGGAGGTVNSVEVALTVDSNGQITLNKSAGLNFAVAMTANAKLLNPIGYAAGDRIRIVARQDATGARLISYDTLYAVPQAQPPALSTAPNVTDMLQVDVSQNGNDLQYLLTPYINAYGTVLPMARIGSAMYYQLANITNTGALNLIQPGQTAYILRDGVGPEATGTISTTVGPGSIFTIAGAPVNGRRPILTMLQGTRPSFGKAVLNFEGSQTAIVRDLCITGARNVDATSRGIAPNADTRLTVRNVQITNCNNGILWGNEDFTGSVDLIDCEFDNNGHGDNNAGAAVNAGFTHNIYAGHNNSSWSATRCSFTNSESGHDIKSRSLMVTLNQVLAKGSKQGRELNLPVGGGIIATNCVFWKPDGTGQNSLAGIGEETIDTNRNRVYRFTNCTFRNDTTGAGRDVTFIINFDPTVKMEFIDCEFIGDLALGLNGDPNGQFPGTVTAAGMRYMPNCAPVYTLTGGPIGPILPVGYFPVDMTPVAG